MSETVQFDGETPWDAIVNHNSLDIEEERAFEAYASAFCDDPTKAGLAVLEGLYARWREE